MTFQFGTQLEDRQPVERIAAEPVEPMQNPEANGGAAAQAARPRNFFCYRKRKRKTATTRVFEEFAGCLRDDLWVALFRRLTLDNGYSVVNAQRDTKAIEAGAKIRGARRNANGNVLHSDTECSDGQRQREPIG